MTQKSQTDFLTQLKSEAHLQANLAAESFFPHLFFPIGAFIFAHSLVLITITSFVFAALTVYLIRA